MTNVQQSVRLAVVCAAGLILAPVTAVADGYSRQGPQAFVERGGLSMFASVGVMWGEANEFVYDPTNGRTVSQLIWKYDNNVVLNGGLEWKPSNWLALGFKGRVALTDDSTMDDFDFNVPGCPPNGAGGTLCHSHHENTNLRRSGRIDLYTSATFYRAWGWSFSGLAGYQWEHSRWEAIGGTANYTVLPQNQSVISYQQWWEAPYLGLQAQGQWGAWSLGSRVIGSWWVNAHDEDNHHLKTTVFTENFKSSDMIGVNANVGYQISKNMSITLDYDYQEWFLAKGPTVINTPVGRTVIPGDAAGADNVTHSVSLGLKYKF
jgi:plasminogen activator